MVRGEKPIELGDSWFSTKSIEVERYVIKEGGRALDGEGWPKALPTPRKLRIPFLRVNILYINCTASNIADRLWALRSKVEREKAQIVR